MFLPFVVLIWSKSETFYGFQFSKDGDSSLKCNYFIAVNTEYSLRGIRSDMSKLGFEVVNNRSSFHLIDEQHVICPNFQFDFVDSKIYIDSAFKFDDNVLSIVRRHLCDISFWDSDFGSLIGFVIIGVSLCLLLLICYLVCKKQK